MTRDISPDVAAPPGRSPAAWAAAAVLAAVVTTTGLVAWQNLHSELTSRSRNLKATARVLASGMAVPLAKRDADAQLQALRAVMRQPGMIYAALRDRDGETLRALGDPDAAFSGQPRILDVLAHGTLPATATVSVDNQAVGTAQVAVLASDLRQGLAMTLLMGLVCGSIASICTYLLMRFLAYWQSRNLSRTEAASPPAATLAAMPMTGGEETEPTGSARLFAGRLAREMHAARPADAEQEARTLQLTAELADARAALQQEHRARNSLIAAIGHEIRIPLAGLAATAERLLAAGLNDGQRRHAEVISRTGQSLLAAVGDLVDLSQLDTGEFRVEHLPLDPVAIADDVAGLYWDSAASHGIDLAVRAAPGLPLSVSGDPHRFRQILSALVGNALKHTGRGQILMSLRHAGSMLHCSVTDSGAGLSPQDLAHVFDPHTGSQGASDDGTSSLFFARKVARAMGGDITASSELGKGSQFILRLPAPQLAAARPRGRLGGQLSTAGLACAGAATVSALGTALVAASYKVEIVVSNPATQELIFADAAQLATLRVDSERQPLVICLCHDGDERGRAALARGLAHELLPLPLRQSDVTDLLDRLHQLGELRQACGLGSASDHAGRRVLVADDSEIDREIMATALRGQGATVETAPNGRAAVEAWRRLKPELVFMDCDMPVMDGPAATREIRAHEALAATGGHTPVIALASGAAALKSHWRDAGMDALMVKPVTLRAVTDCLEAHLAGRLRAAATTETAPEPVLDAATIRDLRQIGGNEALFRRVLDLFAGRVPQAIDQLEAMTREPDLDALADATHALKSMCANIGALRAAAACTDLETAARSRAEVDLGEKLAAILREVRLTLGEVDRLRAA
jgi:signal transduction histidine kinase/CheY-like chemotaxis protein